MKPTPALQIKVGLLIVTALILLSVTIFLMGKERRFFAEWDNGQRVRRFYISLRFDLAQRQALPDFRCDLCNQLVRRDPNGAGELQLVTNARL